MRMVEMVISAKLIARFWALKAQSPSCLPLMQMSAFMSVMTKDARAMAAITVPKLHIGGAVATLAMVMDQGDVSA